MAKKKKKKSISILNEMDNTLNTTYSNIIDEIQDMQLQLNLAEQKARKKVKKKIKKDPNYFDTSVERMEARQQVIERIEGTNLLDRIISVLKDIVPVVIVISRLIASLILSILSFEPIKTRIKPETLKKMNNVYNTAMSVK